MFGVQVDRTSPSLWTTKLPWKRRVNVACLI